MRLEDWILTIGFWVCFPLFVTAAWWSMTIAIVAAYNTIEDAFGGNDE